MTTLIAFSSLVSLITLGVLLFNRRRPVSRALPSAFLGVSSSQEPRQVRLTRPPLLLWCAVACFTVGAALVYLPPLARLSENATASQALVVVDTSSSSFLALRQNDQELDRRLETELAGKYNLHVLERDPAASASLTVTPGKVTEGDTAPGAVPSPGASDTTASPSTAAPAPREAPGTVSVPYAIRGVGNVAELARAVRAQLARGPSPFVRPLVTESLAAAALHHPDFSSRLGTLVVITDGQAESLQNLGALQSDFAALRIIQIAPSTLKPKAPPVEVVPASLFPLWQETAPKAHGFVPFPDAATDKSAIPPQARPGLFQETLEFPTAIVGLSGRESKAFDRVTLRARPARLPMIIACSPELSGPIELDAFADLRTLANFFNSPFRTEDCHEARATGAERAQGNTGAPTTPGALNARDPWEFRPPAIWVVRMNDQRLNLLHGQDQLWLPEGFIPGVDALVYAASDQVSAENAAGGGPASVVERMPVQLDNQAAPVPLFLMPPPPARDVHVPPTRDFPGATGRFAPVYASAGGGGAAMPLWFQLKTSAPISLFYLRTTISMPNGELGRSSSWTGFWFFVATHVLHQGSLLATLRVASPADLAEPTNARAFGRYLRLTKRLDPATLDFVPRESAQAAGDASTALVHPGVYASDDESELLVWDVPEEESSRNFISPSDFEAEWHRPQKGEAPQQQPQNLAANGDTTRRALKREQAFVGLALALLALAALWVFKPRLERMSALVERGSLLLLVCGLLLGGGRASADSAKVRAQKAKATTSAKAAPLLAQSPSRLLEPFLRRRIQAMSGANLPDQKTVPFRVAWCDADVPAGVEARYTMLRNLLASRGTIDMPDKLLAGKCQPGAAEIWWTAQASAIDTRLAQEHVSNGGAFVLEGTADVPASLVPLAEPSIGLTWDAPQKRGLLFRSFYLLSSFDGCIAEKTRLLSLRKKMNAHTPVGLVTSARFLTADSSGAASDCFALNDDLRTRSFVNMMYSFLATDYKEDQLQLPEILNRVRNLGLEP